jgi:hypothetical protein
MAKLLKEQERRAYFNGRVEGYAHVTSGLSNEWNDCIVYLPTLPHKPSSLFGLPGSPEVSIASTEDSGVETLAARRQRLLEKMRKGKARAD